MGGPARRADFLVVLLHERVGDLPHSSVYPNGAFSQLRGRPIAFGWMEKWALMGPLKKARFYVARELFCFIFSIIRSCGRKNHFLRSVVMLRSICGMFAIALVAGAMWSCGGDRVTQSQVAEEQAGRPLSKLAAAGHSLVVVATVHEAETPVSGVTVEFSRSVAGQSASYDWSGMTDDAGQARVTITGGSGYYQARAVRDGECDGFVVEYSVECGCRGDVGFAAWG